MEREPFTPQREQYIYISNVTHLSLRNNNHHRLFDSKRAGIINYIIVTHSINVSFSIIDTIQLFSSLIHSFGEVQIASAIQKPWQPYWIYPS